MFRKASGGTGFSWNRLITNAIPNFANDNPSRDADLTPTEKDILWTYQISGAQTGERSPMTLDAGSALKAGITTSDKISARIHKALVKNGILDPTNPLGIDTTRVTPKFAHQLSFISVAGQRKTIGMLFFWEEEVIRWRLLDQEEAEINSAMEAEGVSEQAKAELRVRLESTRMRRAMRPSERPVEVEGGDGNAQQEQAEGPPQYA
ncbi:uncharacterized protein Z518_09514 [Rhinocladiella mackenziei CBS 650.93]|uniref:Uncharacterized protein n=1 Tax=Rhinocladiella mackenziei CBS 650.93 TaxID=1442369 RepID=A0A0D2FID4_9EURO|nr:uncharacterized protein Z518_09514 [Rhinocladiella mackenziei CBS 650.93]KIX01787.1 hypothetical protein Z518_09514 [Rhinocladiella mackenziei CBS 650.93]